MKQFDFDDEMDPPARGVAALVLAAFSVYFMVRAIQMIYGARPPAVDLETSIDLEPQIHVNCGGSVAEGDAGYRKCMKCGREWTSAGEPEHYVIPPPAPRPTPAAKSDPKGG